MKLFLILLGTIYVICEMIKKVRKINSMNNIIQQIRIIKKTIKALKQTDKVDMYCIERFQLQIQNLQNTLRLMARLNNKLK